MSLSKKSIKQLPIWIKLLSAILIYFIGNTLVILYFNSNRNYIRNNGVLTNGEIEVSGTKVIVRYKVNGKYLTSYRKMSPYQGIQTGERFFVKYLKDNPKKFLVLYDKPLIQEKEFEETKSLYLDFKKDKVVFKYQVEDTLYRKTQMIESGKLDNREELGTYLVKYNISNPKIAYIYLDSLLSGVELLP